MATKTGKAPRAAGAGRRKAVLLDAGLVGMVRDVCEGTVTAAVDRVLREWVAGRYEAVLEAKRKAFAAATAAV